MDVAPARPDPGLQVDPIRVAGRRSMGPILVLVVSLAFVGLALAKPWDPGVRPERQVASDRASQPAVVAIGPASAAPTAEPTARPSRAVPTRPTRTDERRWVELSANPDRLAEQPLVSDRDLGGTDGDGTCGGSARITPFDELIAIVDPAGERITRVRLFPIDTIRRGDVAVRIAPDGGDGLTLVALPRGGIEARQYSLIASTVGGPEPGPLIYTICVG